MTGEGEPVTLAHDLSERLMLLHTTARGLDVFQQHNHLQSVVSVLDSDKSQPGAGGTNILHFAYLAYQRPALLPTQHREASYQ